MNISLKNLGRRFNKEWIFKHINFEISAATPTVVFGSNGSGKSTLLKLISSSEIPSEGEIIYQKNEQIILADKIYQHIGIAAPYMDLPEEFTLNEILDFNLKFKPFIHQLKKDEIAEIAYLQDSINKPIKVFSSGMKQRLKLTLALYTQNDIILLDEPTSNLDQKGVDWYQEQIEKTKKDRTIVVCSNAHQAEYFFCQQEINLNEFKN